MKKVAVILAGCGVYDGGEIHECVLTLLALARAGAQVSCYAPDIEQAHVVNHLTGEEQQQSRNVLVEAARITRGNILSLAEFDAKDHDALVVPGGFGAAKNLSDFAFNGAQCNVEASVLAATQSFAQSHKPAAYLCIAPAMLPKIYGQGVVLTIGDDKDTANAIVLMGGEHVECAVDDFVYDPKHNVLSTPAYMLAQDIVEAANGIEKTIAKLLTL